MMSPTNTRWPQTVARGYEESSVHRNFPGGPLELKYSLSLEHWSTERSGSVDSPLDLWLSLGFGRSEANWRYDEL